VATGKIIRDHHNSLAQFMSHMLELECRHTQ
jgi:hypothetical protein